MVSESSCHLLFLPILAYFVTDRKVSLSSRHMQETHAGKLRKNKRGQTRPATYEILRISIPNGADWGAFRGRGRRERRGAAWRTSALLWPLFRCGMLHLRAGSHTFMLAEIYATSRETTREKLEKTRKIKTTQITF